LAVSGRAESCTRHERMTTLSCKPHHGCALRVLLNRTGRSQWKA
jgi:hypothetical protein